MRATGKCAAGQKWPAGQGLRAAVIRRTEFSGCDVVLKCGNSDRSAFGISMSTFTRSSEACKLTVFIFFLAIQTIDSDELAALMWFQQHRTAVAAHPWRQIYRQDMFSTIFTKICVKK